MNAPQSNACKGNICQKCRSHSFCTQAQRTRWLIGMCAFDHLSVCVLLCVSYLPVFLPSLLLVVPHGPLGEPTGLLPQLTCGKGEINSQFHFAASV